MSAIDALSGGTQQAARPTGMSALTSEDFSKIIFTELSNQDPMSPNDTNALLQQVSTLRSIQDTDLSDRLKSLVRQNQFAAGATLLGKQVSGISDQNQRAQGAVKSVSNTADGPVVTLVTGERIPMSSLDSVVNASGT
jgi:flagellar basal-body rod modification protein FlgD